MAPMRLADRLRELVDWLRADCDDQAGPEVAALVAEAAAALDRTEALEQAAQAWAKAIHERNDMSGFTNPWEQIDAKGLEIARLQAALLALLAPPEKTEEPR